MDASIIKRSVSRDGPAREASATRVRLNGGEERAPDRLGVLLAAFAASGDPLLVISPSGLITGCNAAATRRLGRPEPELLGSRLDEIVVESGARSAILACLESGELDPIWREWPITATDGRGGRFAAVARAAAVEAGEGRRAVLILSPAEGRERTADAELSLLKSLAIDIGACEDADQALTLTLRRIVQVTGWTAGESWLPDPSGEQLRRGPVWSTETEPLQAFHQASVAITFRRGEGLPGRTWASHSPAWIDDVTLDPTFVRSELAHRAGLRGGFAIPVLAGPRVVAVLVFYHAQTRPEDASLVELVAAVSAQLGTLIQRKQAEAEVLRHAEALARSNAELEQFAYVASHDLQEPLRMVSSYTRMLERRYRDRLDEDANEMIDFAVDGVQRMRQLILDLLALSRVDRGGRPEPVELEVVLDAVVTQLAAEQPEATSAIVRDPLPRLVADRGQMEQLFGNLLENALKFRGAEAPLIRVEATREGADWHFVVRDNGIGIEPDYFERIFVIFQRLHTREVYPGNGIGLSICRKIVERHGGRLWVESVPGDGSSFHFTLPAADSGLGGSDPTMP